MSTSVCVDWNYCLECSVLTREMLFTQEKCPANESPSRLYVCSCVHETAETLDGVEEWPDTQTSQQTELT